MSKITKIKAREILDSRGNPTLEVDTTIEEKFTGRFSVPSGASKGKYEALEKRDGDMAHFEGKGVEKLAKRVETEIASLLLGKEFDQKSLDNFLVEKDGTENKSNFGANAVLGISMSFAKAEAAQKNIPLYMHIGSIFGNNSFKLPVPMVNIINGGIHADSGLDIQEFMVMSLKTETFEESLEKCDEVFMHLKEVLKQSGLSVSVGDEGGFAPQIGSHIKALDFIVEAIKKAGFEAGGDPSASQAKALRAGFGIALDCAASEFYFGPPKHSAEATQSKYVLKSENKGMNSDELSDYYEKLINNYPIVSIEDPFDQDDWQAWSEFNKKFEKRIITVGDDLFATNLKRLKEGIEKKAANSILVKLNQVGTLSETLDIIKKAKEAGFKTIISHRSGETEDTSITHLAVGVSSEYIKTGSLSRGERTAKYNELLRIEEELKNS